MESNIISDLFSSQLTLIGISFSIFAIFYSLIIGKIEQLKSISRLLKSGKSSPDIKQLEQLCITSISRLKKTNRFVVIVCFISIILTIILGIAKYLTLSEIAKYIIVGINCLDFLLILFLIFHVFYLYFCKTKFD